MQPSGRIFIKILEFIGCVACLITKALTDIESRRVFLTSQKRSREWGLLHNITWTNAGNAFTNVTFGSYAIITLLFGINRCIDSKSRPTLSEKIFLGLGTVLFFGVGGLLFAAIDQVPSDLHDNAIILGCLSFFVAFLFLIDLGDPMGRKRSGATQTDTNSIDRNDQSKKQIAVISNNANVVSSGSGANAVFAENLNQPDQTDHQANNLQKNAPSTAIKPKNLNVRLPPKTQTQTQYLETDFNEQEAAERFQRAPMQSRNYSQNYRQPKMEAPENHYMEEAAEDEFEYHNGTPQNYRNHNQNLMQESQQMNHNMREDYVQRQIFPTAQTPVFAKVKPAPTIINHFESEPYKKILSRPTQFQQRPNQQYYPQRHVHPQHNHQNPRQQLYHDNANYVDDFAVYRHQTYVQASKVDQGKLVIRDYSKKAQPQKKCDCNHPNCAGPNHFEEEPANPIKIRPGYVANVAKIFDSRMMRVSKPEQQDIKGLSTVV